MTVSDSSRESNSNPGTTSTLGRKRVLITFGRSFLTLNIARLFAAAGHSVTVVDNIALPVSRFSNAVETFIRVPAPRTDPQGYCRALASIAQDHSIDMIIPIHEETDIIAQMRDVFPSSCELFLSDFHTENSLHNKFEFQRLLAEMDVPTLKFAQVRSEEDLRALDFTEPFALKECYSRGSQKIHKVYPGQLPTDIDFSATNPYIAQQWFKGKKYCSYSICRDGEVLAHTVYPVWYAIDGNSCIAFENISHPGIDAWVTDLVKATKFTGQMGLDFIEADGELFTIECNPRGTSGAMMFDAADRIDHAFFGATDQRITPKQGVRRMIGFGMGLYGWKKSALEGNTLRQYVKDVRSIDDVIMSKKDWLPAVMMPIAYLAIARMGVKYKVGLAEAFMHDHEWDGVPIT